MCFEIVRNFRKLSVEPRALAQGLHRKLDFQKILAYFSHQYVYIAVWLYPNSNFQCWTKYNLLCGTLKHRYSKTDLVNASQDQKIHTRKVHSRLDITLQAFLCLHGELGYNNVPYHVSLSRFVLAGNLHGRQFPPFLTQGRRLLPKSPNYLWHRNQREKHGWHWSLNCRQCRLRGISSDELRKTYIVIFIKCWLPRKLLHILSISDRILRMKAIDDHFSNIFTRKDPM